MLAVKEIVKLANESGAEMTIFDLEKLKTGLYQSCVQTAYDDKINLEDVCSKNELNIDVAYIVHDLLYHTGTKRKYKII